MRPTVTFLIRHLLPQARTGIAAGPYPRGAAARSSRSLIASPSP